MYLTDGSIRRRVRIEAFYMVRNSAKQLHNRLCRGKKGYAAISLTLAIVASFLLLFYFGPFGDIKNFGLLSSKKLQEQDSRAAYQYPIDLKPYYSDTGRAENYYLDGFNVYGGAHNVSVLWFEKQDQWSFKLYNSTPGSRCHWDWLGWWDDVNSFRYTKTHDECGSVVKEVIFDPPIIFLPRYWDGNPWTLSGLSSKITTTENGVVVCTGTTSYTPSILGIEEIVPGVSTIHWRTQQNTKWDNFGNCAGWADTNWQEDYWFYDSVAVAGGGTDKGLKRSLGGVVGGSPDNWDVWIEYWKPLPWASPSPTPSEFPYPSPTPIPTPSPTPTPTPTPTPAPISCTVPVIVSRSDTNNSGGGTVKFSWNPIPGASTFRVQRQNSNGSWSTRATTSATSFSGSDSSNDPNWRVFVYSGSCTPIPGPAVVFDP